MNVDYNKTTKKLTVSVSKFDSIICFLTIISICVSILYGVFKPDFQNVIEYFQKREQREQQEKVVFSQGNQLSWQEYRSIIGDKKLMRRYAKQKSVVNGYLSNIPYSQADRYYTAAIVEDLDAEDTTVFIVIFSNKKDVEKLRTGAITIVGDCFYCESNGAYLYCHNPIIIFNEKADNSYGE